MNGPVPLTARRLRSPRAAAIAGILFAALLIAVLLLFLSSVPRDVRDEGAWLSARLGRVVLAINLMPLAGVAFLWFIGVVRDRMADAEDRLFAAVFLGSGLLFLAMMFVAVAVFGAMVAVEVMRPGSLANSTTFALARAFAFTIVNVYAIKMAGALSNSLHRDLRSSHPSAFSGASMSPPQCPLQGIGTRAAQFHICGSACYERDTVNLDGTLLRRCDRITGNEE